MFFIHQSFLDFVIKIYYIYDIRSATMPNLIVEQIKANAPGVIFSASSFSGLALRILLIKPYGD